jgi:hypothetical protein
MASGYQEAVVTPETRTATAYYLPFDNTGGYYYGVALSNTSDLPAGIDVTIRDAVTGQVVGRDTIELNADGHTQFLLTDRYSVTANARGTVQFSTLYGGQASVIGLRFNPTHAFTTVPTLVAGVDPTGTALNAAGTMAHIADAGGWKTVFTLANTGMAAAEAKLSFFDDNGNSMSLPYTLPEAATPTVQTSTTFDQTLQPGTMVVVESAGTGTQSQQGWAKLDTNGSVSGFATFQYQPLSGGLQEAVVPLEVRNTGAYVLPLDNTNGYINGVALANVTSAPLAVGVTIRDAASGSVLGTDTINLAAQGHLSFLLNDRYAKLTTNAAVTLQFTTPLPQQVTVLGLRFNANQAFTSVPALVKK